MAEHLPYILNLEGEGIRKNIYILYLLADYYRTSTLQNLVCRVLIFWFILIIHFPQLWNGNDNSLICLLFVGNEKKPTRTFFQTVMKHTNEIYFYNCAFLLTESRKTRSFKKPFLHPYPKFSILSSS